MADSSKRRCSIKGCGEPLLARGWCSLHYQRWKATGDPGEPERRRRATADVEVDGVLHRRCPSCERTLLLTAEYWNRNARCRGGFANWCKRCRAERVDPAVRAKASRRYYKRKSARKPDHWRNATRAWRLANPDRWKAVALAASRRRYARKYAGGPTDVTADALEALRAAATACPLCGTGLIRAPRQSRSAEVDHIIPLNVGGPHTLDNLRVICRGCNLKRPKDGSDVEGYDASRTPLRGPRARAAKEAK